MAARHPNDPEEEPKTLRGSHRKEHFKGRDSVPYTGIYGRGHENTRCQRPLSVPAPPVTL